MEIPKFENSQESDYKRLVLDKKILNAFWGSPLKDVAEELLKIFQLIQQLKGKEINSKKELQQYAAYLFNESDISTLEFQKVFTDQLLTDVMKASEIKSMSIEYNGHPLIFTADSTVDSLVEGWKKLSDFESPEKEKARIQKEDANKTFIEQQQKLIDEKIAAIDSVDFGNLEEVIEWLYEYNKHCFRGVEYRKDELYEKFAAHGYSSEKNDKIEFMLGETLNDKKLFGEAMVGFMLMNLGLFERGNEMRHTIDDWKKGIMRG